MDKPVVKRKADDAFAEVSFSQSQSEDQPETHSQEQPSQLQPSPDEKIVGLNPLTQKPIIKKVEKKPFIKAVFEAPLAPVVVEEKMAEDVTVAEMRKKQLQDITPISNVPSESEKRELSKEGAADLARNIWEEKEQNKSWHQKLMGRFGFR